MWSGKRKGVSVLEGRATFGGPIHGIASHTNFIGGPMAAFRKNLHFFPRSALFA